MFVLKTIFTRNAALSKLSPAKKDDVMAWNRSPRQNLGLLHLYWLHGTGRNLPHITLFTISSLDWTKCVCVSPGFYDRWLISYIFDLLSNFIPNYNIKKKIAYRNITYLLWSILLYLQDKHKCSQPSQLAKQFILIYFFLYFVIFIIVCNAFG